MQQQLLRTWLFVISSKMSLMLFTPPPPQKNQPNKKQTKNQNPPGCGLLSGQWNRAISEQIWIDGKGKKLAETQFTIFKIISNTLVVCPQTAGNAITKPSGLCMEWDCPPAPDHGELQQNCSSKADIRVYLNHINPVAFFNVIWLQIFSFLHSLKKEEGKPDTNLAGTKIRCR